MSRLTIDLKKIESGKVNQIAFVSLALNLAGVKELQALIEQSESGLLLSGVPYLGEAYSKLTSNAIMLDALERLHFEARVSDCGDMTFQLELCPGVTITVRYNSYDVQWFACAFYKLETTSMVPSQFLNDALDLGGFVRKVEKAARAILEQEAKEQEAEKPPAPAPAPSASS